MRPSEEIQRFTFERSDSWPLVVRGYLIGEAEGAWSHQLATDTVRVIVTHGHVLVTGFTRTHPDGRIESWATHHGVLCDRRDARWVGNGAAWRARQWLAAIPPGPSPRLLPVSRLAWQRACEEEPLLFGEEVEVI